MMGTSTKTVLIKKYPNRKLYNTENSTYISYRDIVELIKEGNAVTVLDNKTKEDITKKTLAQIIFQKEKEALQNLSFEALSAAIRSTEGFISQSVGALVSTGAPARNATVTQ